MIEGRSLLALPRLLWRIQPAVLLAALAHKARSLFVIASVALGVATLTVIVASVDGAREKALELVSLFGPDALLLMGGDIGSKAVGQRFNTLTLNDAMRISRSLPGVKAVLPMRSIRFVRVKSGRRNHETPAIVGAAAGYAAIWNWPLAEGRDLSAEDVDSGAKVALIGDAPAQQLFGDASPLGRTIFINHLQVRIIGRLAFRGITGGGSDISIDDRIILPITTLTQRLHHDRLTVHSIRVTFYEPQFMDDYSRNLQTLLRHQHRLASTEPDDFTIVSATEILRFLTAFTGGIVMFLGLTAVVAMLVGGFVLANLMFLGVAERQEEIGLRKAVGATSIAITLQFLFEALYLTVAGAACGVVLGTGLGALLSSFGLLSLHLSLKIILLALTSALAIALVFGLKPALRAASLDPIDALRGGGG